jgi:hypothetical protein
MLAVEAVGNEELLELVAVVTAELVALVEGTSEGSFNAALELLIQVVAVVEVLVIMDTAVQAAQELSSSNTQ